MKTYLGLNIYQWEESAQNSLLIGCLQPAVEALKERSLVEFFWFDRFDARGPHIFAVLSVPDRDATYVTREISLALDKYLATLPDTSSLSTQELTERDKGRRGKKLCKADGYSGLASNNTYCWFEHTAQGYPFGLAKGLPFESELWLLQDEMISWVICQIAARPERRPVGTAVRWIVEIDREMRRSGIEAAKYWRYHATTLFLDLEQRLEFAEDKIISSIPALLGDSNCRQLNRAWALSSTQGKESIFAARLGELLFNRSFEIDYNVLLRELIHMTLKQLALPVDLHIPLVLFAWQYNLHKK